MYHSKTFILIIFILFEDVCSQQCNDCINYDHCPNAVKLAVKVRTSQIRQLFINASCGYDLSDTPIPKVCCSMFLFTNGEEETNSTPENNPIENHQNLKLLPEECGVIRSDRMDGRINPELHEFPWMALISHEISQHDISFKCAGSIVNKRYVLTAAHCVHGKNVAGVRVGEYDLDNDVDCQKGICEEHIQDIPVEKSIVHENYKELPYAVNDIALLRLAEDIDFEHRNIHRICLPLTNELRHRVLNNEVATVTGWGLNDAKMTSAIPLSITTPVYSVQNCSSLYNRFIKSDKSSIIDEQICVASRYKDSCIGDSGGSLILVARYNNIYRYVQYGIMSQGLRKCGSDYPAVYTNVTKYVDWILDNISS